MPDTTTEEKITHSNLLLDAQPSKLDYRPERGLNRQLLVLLLVDAYVHRHENVPITGPT